MDEEAVRRDERQRIVNWLRKVNQVHISMLDDPRYENQHEKLRIRSQEMNYIINMIWSFDNGKYNKREP